MLKSTFQQKLPYHIGKRAECFNYKGSLPAYGLFARHVKGLKLIDLDIKTMKPDKRKAVYCGDCETIQK